MEQSDSNNYQLACQRYIEFSHKTDELLPINHPNQYFEASMRFSNGGSGTGTQNSSKVSKNNQSYIKKEHVKVEMTQ